MSYPKTEFEQPPRHLRGYEKPYLKAGESKTVEFPLVCSPYHLKKSWRWSAKRIYQCGMSNDRSGESQKANSHLPSGAARGNLYIASRWKSRWSDPQFGREIVWIGKVVVNYTCCECEMRYYAQTWSGETRISRPFFLVYLLSCHVSYTLPDRF